MIVPFTGAGISTECGIPDFRSPGGLWTKNQPIPFEQFLASQEMRDESWRRRFAMEAHLSAARPGRGHLALASLYRAGKVPAVITQNIDNLHQASGIVGATWSSCTATPPTRLCLDCAQRYELDWVRGELRGGGRPRAGMPGCGGSIKTATVSFGQAMPEAAMRRAEELDGGVRSLPRHRVLAGGVAGGGFSADGEAQRRRAGDHQPRADRFRRHRRPRDPRTISATRWRPSSRHEPGSGGHRERAG